MKKILAADIGGTNSRFAAFTIHGKKIRYDSSIWISTNAASSFSHLLELLVHSNFDLHPIKADVAIFGVAGPVVDGLRCSPPNIAWDIDLTTIPDTFCCANALLINDFLAQAYAVSTPAFSNALEITAGTSVPNCPIAMLGAGTGLGKSLLVPDRSGGYLPVPTEGGHGVFPFITKDEVEYAEFLRSKIQRTTIIQDHVLSGSGLEHLFEFHTGNVAPSHTVVAHFTEHPTVLKWFARFYGRVCRNFVLDTFALGGLYITGGIAAKNPIVIEHDEFKTAFRGCEPHNDIFSNIPIKLNQNEESGLWGAAQYGADHLMHTSEPHPMV
ncbi:glucokinase [Halodesulfovibrio sp.]|jgi:glucokinase|uniref:glucokinase n=1 Tax=Halodesulfovibrio sp. TaxID=1912772 RepID=UPI0025EEFFA1|nr:glucokinase [Halodesulfovibrio sp.]MCT4625920.1 glucokinase [Halodesulfovibrio sp.]